MEDDTYSFIVRIWQEAEDNAAEPTAWRGSIEQVGSDQRLYFYDLEGILRFIETQTGITTHRPIIRWRPTWEALKAWFRKEFLSESGK